jgi:hypothetical protein
MFLIYMEAMCITILLFPINNQELIIQSANNHMINSKNNLLLYLHIY